MAREFADALFIDEHTHYSVTEIVTMTGLDPSDLTALVDCGALAPDDIAAPQWSFGAWSIGVARRARSLRDTLDLDDAHALAIVVRFAQRVDALERELARLRVR